MKKDVIIIGAGPGGLASAILLAAAGVKVKILERLPTIAGAVGIRRACISFRERTGITCSARLAGNA